MNALGKLKKSQNHYLNLNQHQIQFLLKKQFQNQNQHQIWFLLQKMTV